MAKRKPATVEDYLARQPDAMRVVLDKVRSAIRKALPRAEEVISYQIPAYRLPGGVVIYFAGWKEHFSLYPATAGVVAALGDKLAGYKVSKGTIRFTLADGVPVGLVTAIAKARAREVAERAAAKAKPTGSKRAGTRKTTARSK